MAILYAESCDGYGTVGNLQNHNNSWFRNIAYEVSSGRYGGGNILARTLSEGDRFLLTAVPGSNMIRISWHMKANLTNATATGNRPVVGFTNTNTNRWWRALITATGVLNISRYDDTQAATIAYTSTASINDNAWHHFEVELSANTLTGSLKLWIDGVLDANSISSGDTSDASSGDVTLFNTVIVGGCSSNTGADNAVRIDDVLVWDDSGTDFTGHLTEPVRLREVIPTANGATGVQFTPSAGSNYQNVDETTFDGDTTYNESFTVGHIDYYSCAALGYVPNAIYGVIVTNSVRNSDIGTRTFRNKLKSSASVANGTTVTLHGDVTRYKSFHGKDPNGTIAWTVAAVQAAQWGGEVVA